MINTNNYNQNNNKNLGEPIMRNTNKKHTSTNNPTTQKHLSLNNKNSNKNNSNFVDWSDKNFRNLVRQAFEQEEVYLQDKTLIPNARNYEKYLYVKKQLNKICKLHNTPLYEEPQQTSAYFVLKLYLLDIAELQILSKITHLCSAVCIDANLNGELEIGVTIPDVRVVLE